jgi:hypothetical protein
MLNRYQKLLLAITLIAVFVVAAWVELKTEKDRRQTLRDNLTAAILQYEDGKATCVDLPTITSFSWDKLYIFRPYRSSSEIDAVLGKFWLGARFTKIETNEDMSLLVFTENGRVVQYVEFTRGRGDFSYADNSIGYDPQDACFIKDEWGYMVLNN